MAKTQTPGEAVVAAIEAAETPKPTGLALLRVAFPPHQISKLPKPLKKREEMDKLPKAKCAVCGGYHQTSSIIHLDYVGHAALTDRLLDADPNWNWEPLGFTPDGLPALDKNGGLWIKLTVCGVTRFGYGAADGKSGGDAIKELIGDALRNAAMRFGAALDLWHKGDLHADEESEKPKAEPTQFELDMEAAAGDGWASFAAAWKDATEADRTSLGPAKFEALKAKARAVAA